MNEILFKIFNSLAMLGWILLIISWWWEPLRKITFSFTISFILAAAYLILMAMGVFETGEGDFSSLKGVMLLFGKEEAVLVGWLHYLAFDLFVGTWILSDAKKRNFKIGYLIPVLFFTFMLGPVGLLIYLIARNIASRSWLSQI